jgi:hypothetical protein
MVEVVLVSSHFLQALVYPYLSNASFLLSSSSPALRAHASPKSNSAPGNIGAGTSEVSPVSLETPTLKTDIFTTGRGGSGNMAKNSDPETARRAQDVVAHPRTETGSDTHVGRGGAANVFRPSEEEAGRVAEGEAEKRRVLAEKGPVPREVGLADKGKEWLSGVIGGRK